MLRGALQGWPSGHLHYFGLFRRFVSVRERTREAMEAGRAHNGPLFFQLALNGGSHLKSHPLFICRMPLQLQSSVRTWASWWTFPARGQSRLVGYFERWNEHFRLLWRLRTNAQAARPLRGIGAMANTSCQDWLLCGTVAELANLQNAC